MSEQTLQERARALIKLIGELAIELQISQHHTTLAEFFYVVDHYAKHAERPRQESFVLTCVSRADLDGKSFDTSEVPDNVLEDLADKLGDDYVEQLFWTSMEIIAEERFHIPRKPKTQGSEEDTEGEPERDQCETKASGRTRLL
jgi:hypothetical protein